MDLNDGHIASLMEKNKQKLAILTAYRLSKASITGDDTSYKQQYRILRRQNIMNPKPKNLFDDDRCQLLNKWKQVHYDIILMIDENNDLTDKHLQKSYKVATYMIY